MRLTKQTNYGLRILMYCATNDVGLSRIQDIAKSYGVSETFMFKILQSLVKAGFVETVRGRNGGIKLAQPAANITMLNVVKVTEDQFLMAECFDAEFADCPLIDACNVNKALREALNAFFDVLSRYTIADLVENRVSMMTLLGIDAVEGVASNPV